MYNLKKHISPNVKVMCSEHFNITYTQDALYSHVVFHKNDIIEIQINNDEIIKKLQNSFNVWFNHFKKNGLVEDVSITGVKENINDGLGSSRYSTNSLNLSIFLDKIIRKNNFVSDNYIGVSEYFRFMQYNAGGQHYPHYDSDYEYSKEVSTKYSLVMYFNDCDDGEIYFCNDYRENHSNTDWIRQAKDDEIYLKFKPKAGRIIIFPHNLCHGVKQTSTLRNIVRGDLITY